MSNFIYIFALNLTYDKKKMNLNIKYCPKCGKSEYQIHLEWMRRLLINMQDVGIDNRYGNTINDSLSNEIKWLTDKIELSKRENTIINSMEYDYEDLNEKEKKVLSLINDLIQCICYPNDACFPNVKTVTKEFENIFNPQKNDNIIIGDNEVNK